MRNRLVMLEPLIGLGDGLPLGIAQGLSIFLGRDHGFEQMNHGSELAGAELVEQMMGMLCVSRHYVPPWSRCCAMRRRLRNGAVGQNSSLHISFQASHPRF